MISRVIPSVARDIFRISLGAMRLGMTLALLLGTTQGALAATFPLPPPNDSVVGDVGFDVTREDDTLIDVARRHHLGYEELILANPAVDHWLPPAGTTVTLPTRYILPPGPREGIVVNIAEFRLYYYPKPKKKDKQRVVHVYSISAGREDWQTPQTARTQVVAKVVNPAWYPPKTIRKEHADDGRPLPAIVPPGPDNPLGKLALKLGIKGGYFIHGSSKPFGIGMQVTHGCLRLYPDDMEALFKMVPVGTKVRVIDQPYKTGWKGGVLYLEVHTPALQDSGEPTPAEKPFAEQAIKDALARRPNYDVDWDSIDMLLGKPQGMPIAVPPRAREQASVSSRGAKRRGIS